MTDSERWRLPGREHQIANAMNLARDSNITDLATEDRVRQLVIDYVFNSDSESDPVRQAVQSPIRRTRPSLLLMLCQTRVTALVNSDNEVDDADLVVIDDTQPLLTNIAGETEDMD